jgi:RecB family exonuclease
MAKRVESPSSINTFKQCKRKYFYQYVKKLPTSSNIHCVRGNIAHTTLENFFDVDVSQFNETNYEEKLKGVMQTLLLHYWNQYKAKLDELDLKEDKKKFYFEETMMMLINWNNHFLNNLKNKMKEKNVSMQEAFQLLTPVREERYVSDNYSVQGFIDAIHHLDDQVHIVDYKTNSRFDMKSSIKLQLAIYSLLYFEKHGKTPDKVGICFLRQKTKMINVNEELINLAKQELELIHAHTSITEEQPDYPKTITPLCRWSTGQCDFYETCKPHD